MLSQNVKSLFNPYYNLIQVIYFIVFIIVYSTYRKVIRCYYLKIKNQCREIIKLVDRDSHTIFWHIMYCMSRTLFIFKIENFLNFENK